jgi:hypothetical protein
MSEIHTLQPGEVIGAYLELSMAQDDNTKTSLSENKHAIQVLLTETTFHFNNIQIKKDIFLLYDPDFENIVIFAQKITKLFVIYSVYLVYIYIYTHNFKAYQ